MSSYLRSVFLVFLLLPASGMAEVFKCIDGASGKINFSDRPCSEGQKQGEIRIFKDAPSPSPQAPTSRTAASQARQKEQAAQDERMKAISDAAAEVRRIKAENADPKKCAEVRRRLYGMKARDPIGIFYDVDYLEYQQKERLYCGN
jgi:cell pole-organizing protein PopZ